MAHDKASGLAAMKHVVHSPPNLTIAVVSPMSSAVNAKQNIRYKI
jgi:hypothetical protein